MPAPYVVLRRKRFYFRLRTPAWLAPHLGRSHVVQTLNTSDAKVAAGRAAGAAAFWQEEFRRLRALAVTLSEKDLRAVARHWYKRCAEAGVREWLQALAPGELSDVYDDAEERARRVVASTAAAAEEDVPAGPDVRLTLGAWTILDGSGYLKAGRDDAAALIPMMQDVVRAEITAQFQKVFEPGTAQLAQGAPKPPPSKEARKPISAHEEAFLAWKGDSLGGSAKASHRAAFRRFREVVGDRPFHEYAKKDAKAFRNHLLTSGGARHGREQKARATIVKEISHLRGLFEWAVQEEEYGETNPFEGMKLPPAKKGTKSGTVKRDFSRKELERIFAAPLFRGARSGHYSHDPGPLLIADGRFWMPLVALMTGARLGELEQLRTADVRFEEGIDWIFITNDPTMDDDPEDRELTLKTENARRSIPIMPELKRLGFMDYVEHRRQLGEYQLFDKYDYGKYFNDATRFLARLGIKVPEVSFHSFRHCYKQMLRGAIPSDETKNRLMGHSAATVGEAYGPTLTPEEGRQFLDTCRPHVNLSHIVPYMERARPRGTRRRRQRHRSRKRPALTMARQDDNTDPLVG